MPANEINLGLKMERKSEDYFRELSWKWKEINNNKHNPEIGTYLKQCV